MRYECEIKRESSADVVVVGGGTAGVFAAISAARTGAKTVLVEKNSILGGTMTSAEVNFPGLFFAWGKQIIGGPCWESIERTVAAGGAVLPEITFKPKNHWDEQIRLNKFVYINVLFDMCEECGVDVLCNTMLADVKESNDGVTLFFADKEGIFAINAKTAVDATGDADLCKLAKFSLAKSKTLQPATKQNHISGYDMKNVSRDEIEKRMENTNLGSHISADMIYGWLQNGIIDMHVPCEDADTSRGRTNLEKKTLHMMADVYKFLRSIDGLANLTIDRIANETGVRETNRIVGKGTVTADDYINGRFYDDTVCYAFYPIDLHVMDGIEQKFHEENVVAKIPYSSLVPQTSRKILCAGRCISSDTYANSAIRVEAVCMATGQAAGCAAALSAKNGQNVGDVDYAELCDVLHGINAIIPNKKDFI